ncbi:MAG: hypothetical protein H8D35_00145 [Nitrosopumilus sp.]|nr:hypothetical protein [Nitrosopumilus sp.]
MNNQFETVDKPINLANLTADDKTKLDELDKSLVGKKVSEKWDIIKSVKTTPNKLINLTDEERLNFKENIELINTTSEQIEIRMNEIDMIIKKLDSIQNSYEKASNKYDAFKNKPRKRNLYKNKMRSLSFQIERLSERVKEISSECCALRTMNHDAEVTSHEWMINWVSENKIQMDEFLLNKMKDELDKMKEHIRTETVH